MLNYIYAEFMKLRRRRLIIFALLSSIAPPALNIVYTLNLPKNSIINRTFGDFSKFFFTQWLLLPCVLTMIALIIFYAEQENNTMRQLRIVPVSTILFILSKLVILLLFSLAFMLINAGTTILGGYIVGYGNMNAEVIWRFIRTCIIAGIVIMLAIMPIITIAIAAKKDYIIPTCAMLIYCISGVIFARELIEIHPLSSGDIVIWTNNIGKDMIKSLANIILIFVISIAISVYAMKKQEG